MNRFLLLFAILWLASESLFAQLNINVTKDYIRVDQPFANNEPIRFSNKWAAYAPELRNFGLHFYNNETTVIDTSIIAADLGNASPVIGVHGSRTKVLHNGRFKSDGNQSVPSFVLTDSGRFEFGPKAKIDLMQDGSYFTRQFWVLGDGTGVLSFAEGFTADLSQFGTVPDGYASVRLSNAILETHHTRNVPASYRPQNGGPKFNAHLAFENQHGSKWRVLTNDQEYQGGFWLFKNGTVETQTNLTISGLVTKFSDNYINYGGIMFRDSNTVLTKTGQAELKITGDQAYAPGSEIVIENGTVGFYADPLNDSISYFNNGQNLKVNVQAGGHLRAAASRVRLRELALQSGSLLTLGLLQVLEAPTAKLEGILHVQVPANIHLSAGQVYTILKLGQTNGLFSKVEIPDFDGQITWDLSELYTKGQVEVASGSVHTTAVSSPQTNQCYLSAQPNPFSSTIRFVLGNSIFSADVILRFVVTDMAGKIIVDTPAHFTPNGFFDWDANGRNKGMYFYKFLSPDNRTIDMGKIVKI